MRILQKPNPKVGMVLGGQLPQPNVSYKVSQFLFRPTPEAVGSEPEEQLVLHTVTREVLLLDRGEAETLERAERNGSIAFEALTANQRELISHYCLVPSGQDETQDYLNLTDILQSLTMGRNPDDYYDILTATDCNARCAYCYEAGARKRVMTPETGRLTGEYILRTKKPGPVSIRWFGGEPLLGARAIEEISKTLNAAKVPFTSFMISNGSLFTPELIRQAVESWHLKLVQITLDGRSEAYNRIKGYVTDLGASAFERVMGNIDLLAKAGIFVQLRLNVGTQNADELLLLARELTATLSGEGWVSVYTEPLFQQMTREAILTVLSRCREIDAVLQAGGILRQVTRPMQIGGVSVHKCLPSAYGSIDPDGRIILCTKYFDRSWEEHSVLDVQRAVPPRPKLSRRCERCTFLPSCMGYTGCHMNPDGCQSFHEILTGEKLRYLLRKT